MLIVSGILADDGDSVMAAARFPMEQRILHYHEAGRAVAALALGLPVYGIDLNPATIPAAPEVRVCPDALEGLPPLARVIWLLSGSVAVYIYLDNGGEDADDGLLRPAPGIGRDRLAAGVSLARQVLAQTYPSHQATEFDRAETRTRGLIRANEDLFWAITACMLGDGARRVLSREIACLARFYGLRFDSWNPQCSRTSSIP